MNFNKKRRLLERFPHLGTQSRFKVTLEVLPTNQYKKVIESKPISQIKSQPKPIDFTSEEFPIDYFSDDVDLFQSEQNFQKQFNSLLSENFDMEQLGPETFASQYYSPRDPNRQQNQEKNNKRCQGKCSAPCCMYYTLINQCKFDNYENFIDSDQE